MSPLACCTVEFYTEIDGAYEDDALITRNQCCFFYVGLCCYVSFPFDIIQTNKPSGPVRIIIIIKKTL